MKRKRIRYIKKRAPDSTIGEALAEESARNYEIRTLCENDTEREIEIRIALFCREMNLLFGSKFDEYFKNKKSNDPVGLLNIK